jgi:cytochrome c
VDGPLEKETPMRRPYVAIVALALLLGPSAARAADNDLELAFNDHCRECHSFVKDDNRLGPSLYGVFGRKAGTATDYAYSDSLKGSNITWNAATLDKWIANPQAVIPGNDMSPPYPGIDDPAIRKKIIAFLKTLGPKGGAKSD